VPHHEDICAPATLVPGKEPGTHCIGCWVVPRASLDPMVKTKSLPTPCWELSPGCPACSLVTTLTEVPWLQQY